MHDVIEAIKDWPVLVQGAVGSALFWIFLTLGQKITRLISDRIRSHSKKRQLSYLRDELLRLRAYRDGKTIESMAHHSSVMLYRASRHIVRALLWLILGMIFKYFISIFALIGYIGCLYHLFLCYDVIKPFKYDGNIEEKMQKVRADISEIQDT